jgi:hypothetical protein
VRLVAAASVAAVLSLLGHPAAAADAEAGLAQVLESYRGLALGTTSLPVQNRVLQVGHMKMTFATGALYPLVGKGGEVLGFFFKGTGRYDYASADPADRMVLATNVQRNAPRLVLNNEGVWDEFSEALLFSAAPVVGELATASGPGPDGSVASGFQRIWSRVALTYLPYDHLAAEARLNGGRMQYVYAEFEGAREITGYTMDRVRTFDEVLTAFRKFQGVDVRFPETLSQQDAPIAGASQQRVALKDARIEVSTADNRSGSIVSDLTFDSQWSGLRVVSFNLMNNRKEESYDWAATKNALEVTKVLDASGNPLPFSHRYHEILVQLPAPVDDGDFFQLRFETEGDVFTNPGGGRDDSYFQFLRAPWYPMTTDESFFTFNLKVRTKKPWLPIASGTTVALRETGDGYELETRSNTPSTYVTVMGGNYKSREEKIGNITYRVHGYAMARKQVMENLPKLADAIVRFYESQLGPYPFEELDIVEIPSYGFGIAPSGVVLITTEAYRPDLDWLSAYLSGGVNNRLAHEIAHHWFGHKAAPASDSEAWLAESFAEYLAGMAMAALNPDERQTKGWKGMMSGWKGHSKECTGAPLERASFLGGARGGEDYWCLVYNRGPLVLHMFHTMIGDQAFFAVMKKILDNANFKLIDVDDVKAAQKTVLRNDMGWFFDEWTYKAGIPEVRVTHHMEGNVLSGRVEQAPERFIKMVIPLVLDYPDGRRDVRVFVQERPSQDFRYELPAVPKKVTVDPAGNNLAVYR